MTDDLPPTPEPVIDFEFTPSPTAKLLVVGLSALIGGVLIGLAVSAILKDATSDAPHVPTRVRDLDPVQAYFEESDLEEKDPNDEGYRHLGHDEEDTKADLEEAESDSE